MESKLRSPDNKSISPIIATMLLVILAIVVAALFLNWYTGVQVSYQDDTQTSSETLVTTSGTNIQIISAKAETDEIRVRNNGGATVVNVTVLLNGAPTGPGLEEGLAKGKNVAMRLSSNLTLGDVIEIVGTPGGYDRQVVR